MTGHGACGGGCGGCGCGCGGAGGPATPASTYNPPGLSALAYRVGTHGQFMASMLERLSGRPELERLTARTADDPAVALLDCWAVVADILTFYGERHAQEGYLATAVEPESLVRLGRLVGHRPRPALGAGGYLAYTLDPGARAVVPAGSQAKSVPAQGQLPQAFETSEDLPADARWNTLAVRMTAPPRLEARTAQQLERLTFAGPALGIKPGDRLLLLFGTAHAPAVRVAAAATADYQAALTVVDLVPLSPADPVEAALDALLTASDSGPPVPAAAVLRTAIAAAIDRLAPDGGPASRTYWRLADASRLLGEGVAFTAARSNTALAGWMADDVTAAVRAVRAALVAVAAERRRSLPEVEYLRELAHSLTCPGLGRERTEAEDPDRERDPDPDRERDLDRRRDPDRERVADRDGCGSRDCDRATALVATSSVLPALRRTPPGLPAAGRDLSTGLCELWDASSDSVPGLLAAADPRLAGGVHQAWATQRIAPPRQNAGVQVLRVKARPLDPAVDPHHGTPPEGAEYLYLEGHHDGVLPGTRVLAEQARPPHPARVVGVVEATQLRLPFPTPAGAPAVFVPVTRLTVDGPWHADPPGEQAVPYGDITVWAAGEDLTLAEDPVTDDVAGSLIELAQVCPGLLPGRRLVVSGERTDVPGTTGVLGSEPAMLAAVRQGVGADTGGDTVHTTLVLAAPLTYTYRRDSVTVHGNVVPATQGETRSEVLGSGDAARPGQSFALRQVTTAAPLTYLPADTPGGAEPALTVRVDAVRRHRAEDLSLLGPADQAYGLAQDAAGTATISFGDGVHGSRLPTGVENVTAVYRVGAGPEGNLPPGRITQAVSRPLGVNAVTNPLAATGAAAADGPRDTRAGIPLRTRALDRLLSVRDYADFARARAGIGRAAAALLFDGRCESVHVTVAGAGDVPLSVSDPLLGSLSAALSDFGDPHLPVRVDVRELVLLVLSAGLKVLPDHSFETVEPAVRAAVLGVLGFAARDLAEPALLSRVLAAMQAVPGVDHVDVDVFAGIAAAADPLALVDLGSALRGAARTVEALPARAEPLVHDVGSDPTGTADTLTSVAVRYGVRVEELVALNPGLRSPVLERGRRLVVARDVRPAQLAVMTPDLPETLILRRLP
ncbi:putative baseplate assembly protein [Streptomyces sp. NPDC060031]|uniref:putative baseplate assembly protein n=1 Tax=Streptomyces sp. NPDC060031 TaxID=3347043 RepID=UPI00369E1961